MTLYTVTFKAQSRGGTNMVTTRYTAIFQSGKTMTFIESPRFRNQLDIYNYICFNRLGKKYGTLVEIRADVMPGY